MTDEQLGEEIAPDASPEDRARMIARMSPGYRASVERLIEVAAEINAGNIPEGVIVCRERGRRGR